MNVTAHIPTSSGRQHSRCACLVTLLISFVLPVSAQPSQTIPSNWKERIFKEGVVAYESDQYDLATTKFAEVFASDPAFYIASVGSATFWWGRALAVQGRSDEAHRIWSAGIGALENSGIVDPRLTSAYIESVFKDDRSTHFARAADAYLRLLQRTSNYSHVNETCVAIERIAQLLPLLTEKELNRVAERVHPNRCARWRLTEEAGSFLVAWWRKQDPILSTARNEHLEIHLKRAVSAQSRFKADRLVSQFDDRGKMYIRYGEPTQQISYGRTDQALSQRLEVVETTDSSSPPLEGSSSFGPGNPVVTLPSGMPRGELWVYDGIHASAYYFFVQEGHRYRLGQVSDLIPSHLRNFWGFRGKRRAEVAANILFGDGITTGIYERLASVHPDFAAIQTSFEMAQGGRGNFPSVWMQIRTMEGESAWARDQQMPVHHTGYHSVDSLGIDVRTARFLEQNGDTRTEVYWQVDPRWFLQASPRLQVTALQLRGNYEIREATHLAYEIDVSKEMKERMLEPQTLSLRGDSGLYHLAIQWRAAINGKRAANMAEHDIPPHRMTTMRIDSVEALTNDETVLEVSDLLIVRDQTHSTVSSRLLAHGARRPIPSNRITAQDTVSLYFEVYHLAFGSDDRTHYSLEYEVSRLRRGGLLKLFRMEHRRTAARTTVTGKSRRTSELIAIPTDEWVPGKVTLTVRVTDESTGQQIERSTSLEFRK